MLAICRLAPVVAQRLIRSRAFCSIPPMGSADTNKQEEEIKKTLEYLHCPILKTELTLAKTPDGKLIVRSQKLQGKVKTVITYPVLEGRVALRSVDAAVATESLESN